MILDKTEPTISLQWTLIHEDQILTNKTILPVRPKWAWGDLVRTPVQWHHGMVCNVTCDTICDELHGVMSYVISQLSGVILMLFYPLLTKVVCDVTYIFRYDMYMIHIIWQAWYDMTKCVFYHMYMISIQNLVIAESEHVQEAMVLLCHFLLVRGQWICAATLFSDCSIEKA